MRLALVVLAALAALSQPKSSLPAEESNPTDGDQKGSSPLVTPSIAPHEQSSTTSQVKETREDAPYWEKVIEPGALANIALLGVGIWGICVALRTLKAMERSNNISSAASNSAVRIANASEHSVHAIERCYVDLSHHPPGLFATNLDKQPLPDVAADMPLWVGGLVKNHGHTPARVLAVVLTCHIGTELPDSPPYTDHETWGEFFLMPSESFNSGRIIHAGVSEEQLRAIRDGSQRLWVIGYVDSEDIFGVRARMGYARRFSPGAANNLVFETKGRYNYYEQRP